METVSVDDSDRAKVFIDDFELTTNTPDKDAAAVKSIGFISAQPSEFLIVLSRGKLLERACGQGARHLKWPWESVVIVPTTLKEIIFQANQITADNVDVRIRGVVMYRIVDPFRIYKLINFARRRDAEYKLARMIADMCRSTAKWLVANMRLEDCIRRRKEEIARSLLNEVSAVVSHDGPRGWGVEIVTIDINDIYIQDTQLFVALQTKFKTETEREAQLARLATDQEVEKRKIASQLDLEQDRHDLDLRKAKLNAAN